MLTGVSAFLLQPPMLDPAIGKVWPWAAANKDFFLQSASCLCNPRGGFTSFHPGKVAKVRVEVTRGPVWRELSRLSELAANRLAGFLVTHG